MYQGNKEHGEPLTQNALSRAERKGGFWNPQPSFAGTGNFGLSVTGGVVSLKDKVSRVKPRGQCQKISAEIKLSRDTKG